MEVKLDRGRIAALAHEVRGCVLCRAAASVIGRHAQGLTRAEAQAIDTALRGMLGGGDPPSWPDLAAFRPVARHKSRHECVMLPFDALVKALEAAGPAAAGAGPAAKR